MPARDPVSCASHGHLFCRECAVSNLLAQNKELKRLKKEAERRAEEDAAERGMEDEARRARDVEEFERVQAGLSVKTGGQAGIVGRRDGKVVVEQEVGGGRKRQYEVEEDDLLRMAKEGEHARKRVATGEKVAELPSFWVPSETPGNKKAALRETKKHPTCPAAEAAKPHDFALKTLVAVHFHEEKPGPDSAPAVRSCPSCNKALSNSTKAVLAKPCGHVICKPCSDQFQKPPEKSAHDAEHDATIRCYVCQGDITPGRKAKRKSKDGEEKETDSKVGRGTVELSSEGTGFAGRGKNMVKKEGVAFQC